MKLFIPVIAGTILFAGCSNDKQAANEPTKVEQSDKEAKIKNVGIKNVGDKRLEVKVEATGENLKYAYYVYKDNEILHKMKYSNEGELTYRLDESGDYRVRVFVKADNAEDTLIENTDVVKIEK